MGEGFSPTRLANYLIKKHGAIGFVKLQKEIYCAHGWWLALQDEPLVNEEPEAWDLGPVFATLFHDRKGCGLDQEVPLSDGNSSIPAAVENFLDVVHTRYAPFSASQMIAMTHAVSTPWHEVAGQYVEEDKEIPRHLKIPNALIKKHFLHLREKADNV